MKQRGSGEVNVDGTFFSFPRDWAVAVFDEWPQYRKAAGGVGLKGVDVVALHERDLWLIEMKDYTYPDAQQPQELPVILGQKAAGTMALLYSLERAKADSEAKEFAVRCRAAKAIHLALHIEVKDAGRKEKQIHGLLSPLTDEIRKVGKTIGLSKTWVTSTLAPNPHTPWRARRDPERRARHVDR
ncbi:hypothetical protein [Corynebacterium lowii]|uniref:hypothetical protein n=1 Tax=Corynebacterium lowii TaxID=1544413 RepID=UPI001FE21967|nr:hypothetical protein [Corynebacterium lowii]MDP9851524.1 hypothetical protein [Corynebacterium lowii]